MTEWQIHFSGHPYLVYRYRNQMHIPAAYSLSPTFTWYGTIVPSNFYWKIKITCHELRANTEHSTTNHNIVEYHSVQASINQIICESSIIEEKFIKELSLWCEFKITRFTSAVKFQRSVILACLNMRWNHLWWIGDVLNHAKTSFNHFNRSSVEEFLPDDRRVFQNLLILICFPFNTVEIHHDINSWKGWTGEKFQVRKIRDRGSI